MKFRLGGTEPGRVSVVERGNRELDRTLLAGFVTPLVFRLTVPIAWIATVTTSIAYSRKVRA